MHEYALKMLNSLEKSDYIWTNKFWTCRNPECVWCSTKWHSGKVVITTAQHHSSKSELRLCAGSNSAGGALAIRDGENLCINWSQLEIRLNFFRHLYHRNNSLSSSKHKTVHLRWSILHKNNAWEWLNMD